MGVYTDAWLQTQFYADPDRFTVRTPPDPGHGDMSEADPINVQMDAPVSQPGGHIYTDVFIETVRSLPDSDPIETEPVSTQPGLTTAEQTGHGYGGIFQPGATVPEMSTVRGMDKGSAKRSTTDTIPHMGHGWMVHEQPFTTRSTGLPTAPMANLDSGGDHHTVLRRGLNSDPINNGDSGRPDAWHVDSPSWKTGLYQQTNIQRDFRPPSLSHHELKYTQERTITVIGDAPPPVKSTKYDSPFSSLQKFMPKAIPIGGIRRQPGPWYESAVAAEPTESPLTTKDRKSVV